MHFLPEKILSPLTFKFAKFAPEADATTCQKVDHWGPILVKMFKLSPEADLSCLGSSIFFKGEAHVKRWLCVSGGKT